MSEQQTSAKRLEQIENTLESLGKSLDRIQLTTESTQKSTALIEKVLMGTLDEGQESSVLYRLAQMERHHQATQNTLKQLDEWKQAQTLFQWKLVGISAGVTLVLSFLGACLVWAVDHVFAK